MYAKHKQICNVIQLELATGYTIFSTGEFHMVYESSVETEFSQSFHVNNIHLC